MADFQADLETCRQYEKKLAAASATAAEIVQMKDKHPRKWRKEMDKARRKAASEKAVKKRSGENIMK